MEKESFLKILVFVPDDEFKIEKSFLNVISQFNGCILKKSEIFIGNCLENCDVIKTPVFLTKVTNCLFFSNNNIDTEEYHCYKNFVKGFAIGKNAVFSLSSEFKNSSSLKNFLNSENKKMKKNHEISFAKEKLLNHGICVDDNSLCHAVSEGEKDIVSLFFKAGFSPEVTTKEGVPLLVLAVREKQDSLVPFLISSGANINNIAKDRGYSALMECAKLRDLSIAKILLKNGADPNLQSLDGQNALILAVCNNDYDFTSLLISFGANPKLKDKLDMSAEKYATLFHNKEIISLFS